MPHSQHPSSPHGLHNIPAVSSAISSIHGEALAYRGIPIDELAEHGTFEEIAYLLWHGRLPGRAELIACKQQLTAAAVLPQSLVDILGSFPRRASPMERYFCASVSSARMEGMPSTFALPASSRPMAAAMAMRTPEYEPGPRPTAI